LPGKAIERQKIAEMYQFWTIIPSLNAMVTHPLMDMA
jgi:hypothetical protein